MTPRTLRLLRLFTAIALAAAVLTAAIGTRHWPIVGDAPLFHYIDFLIAHGKVPYRDIIDINLLGTYAFEHIGLRFFAAFTANPALAWRFFDFALLALAAIAMVFIALPVDWLAGAFAAALFALIHFRDGPTHTGQRDLMMTALLLPACAFLFSAVRRNSLIPAVTFGLCAGAAATIKPSGILFAAALLVFFCLQPTSKPARLLALLGIATPIAVAALWLHHIGALAAFLTLNRTLVPYHASLGRPSFAALVIGSFPSVLLAVAIPALAILFFTKPKITWRAATLLTCTALGCASYILQGKGFPYHRYPTEAFLLLGCALLIIPALKSPTACRYCALLGVLLATLYLAPASAAIALHYDTGPSEFIQQLTADLTTIAPTASLQNQVQCLDMTSGCLATLDQLQLVQATGFLYDCYAFQPTQTPTSLRYREDLYRALTAAAPKVLVLTDQQCFAMTRDWTAPTRWPQFTAWVAANYTLQKQYTPPHLVAWWRKPAVPYSYRLYLRKDAAPSPAR